MKLYTLAPLLLQKLIWIPTRLLLVVCGRLTIKGLENIKNIQGPVIFAVNHSNDIDPFMVPATLPFWSPFSPLFYVVREKSFYEGKGVRKELFNSWFIKLWGGYGAAVGIRDYGVSLKQHIQILQDGYSFCFYPEGRITPDGNLLPGKGGISYLAHSAPCTIVPVGISHVYKMTTGDFFARKRKIVVAYGKPIDPKTLYSGLPTTPISGENVWKKEADAVMERIAELIER